MNTGWLLNVLTDVDHSAGVMKDVDLDHTVIVVLDVKVNVGEQQKPVHFEAELH
jgi:hypothetical protein